MIQPMERSLAGARQPWHKSLQGRKRDVPSLTLNFHPASAPACSIE
ncbi:hypothetical protein H6F80_07790 [Leptolyngbya sp. FACHB-711]|nr:hypothetical protein [Leptolyngbya sp. FACHB-711]